MHEITVKRQELIEKLRANRAAHRSIFEEATKVYRERAIKELDAMLDAARRGDQIARSLSLPLPEDHTDDYDRVIGMLEMEVADVVKITEEQFRCYVQDQWGWIGSFGRNTRSYTGR